MRERIQTLGVTALFAAVLGAAVSPGNRVAATESEGPHTDRP